MPRKKSTPARPWPYQKLDEENAMIRAAERGLRLVRAVGGWKKVFFALGVNTNQNKIMRAALVTYHESIKKYSHAHTDFDPAPTCGSSLKNQTQNV